MACKYYFKGHEFSSELELDDFLLSKEQYRSQFGDIVFDRELTTSRLEGRKKLEDHSVVVKQLEDKFEEARRNRIIIDGDVDSYSFEKPYIGVNKYLSLFGSEVDPDDEHTRLYPEFKENEYWDRRFNSWKSGVYSDVEAETFFPELVGNTNDFPKITDENELKRMKGVIENKWAYLCLYGDAIHAIYEMFFSKNESGVYNKDVIWVSSAVREQLYNELCSQIYTKKLQDGSKKSLGFGELISKEKYEDILRKCVQFDNKIKTQFGDDCDFYPEYKISTKLKTPGLEGEENLMGIIDLLILDKNGVPHILDYKTSPKGYKDYASAKKLAFMYQVATYEMMLLKLGFQTDESQLHIVPIQFEDFKAVGVESDGITEKFDFASISHDPQTFKSLKGELSRRNYVRNNLSDIIDLPISHDVAVDDLLQKVQNAMSTLFPNYLQYKSYDDEAIAEMIKRDGGIQFDEEKGKHYWKPKGSMNPNFRIEGKDEADVLKKVKDYKNNLKRTRRDRVDAVIVALKDGHERRTAEVDFPEQKTNGDKGFSPNWFRNRMAKYCTRNWKVQDGPQFNKLKELGIIVLFNDLTHLYDFVRIAASSDLKYQYNFGTDLKPRRLLSGAHVADIEFESRQDSLMLDAAAGNIELMETMLAINLLRDTFGGDKIVGDIFVADPVHGYGIGATNKQLKYTFDNLLRLKPIEGIGNNFAKEENGIKLGSIAQSVYTQFTDIMTSRDLAAETDHTSKWNYFTSCKSSFDSAILSDDIDKKIKELENLRKLLEENWKNELKGLNTDQEILAKDYIQLYNTVMLALAELKGYNFRQLLYDHDKYCETLNMAKYGWSGTYIDNPGNLSSDTLNLLTRLVTEAYLNVRADMQEPTAKMRELIDKLKKRKNFGWLTENTIGNQADLYKNLYEDPDKFNGDLVFKNPWKDGTLLEEERELLKYTLTEINKRRFPSSTFNQDSGIGFFLVPLAKGDTSSKISKDGLLSAFKDRVKGWLPLEALIRNEDQYQGIADRAKRFAERKMSEEAKRSKHRTELFSISNQFDIGEQSTRMNYIENVGLGYFETNLETLFLKHSFAYSMKNRIDEVMPMIKAATIHLATSGYLLNTSFDHDLEYAEDYIRNKIKNESIVDPKHQPAEAFLNKLKSAVSKMLLGFSGVQVTYQTIQGLWNAISLIIRKPDGSDAFTVQNMWESAKIVYRDLFHIGNKPTLVQLFNELYGVNDMDMNSYIDKIKSDQHGMLNFTNLTFMFASRPDYYNRMLIFCAKMINEGCLEAHHVSKEGRLIYNWKEDKRFNLFANGINKGSVEYNQQKALYYEMAKLFVTEGTKNPDGTLFELDMQNPKPLPRAYTNKEAESMKSLSDTIYGYYSHEKKSLIQSTLLGSMWLQFKTYWSGKKNQYLGKGGVKLEGNWKHYSEVNANGEEIFYYYQVDPNGTVRRDKEPIGIKKGDPVPDNVMPFMRWEGNWKEGIITTVFELSGGILKNGLRDGWMEKWYNPDPNLRNVYRSNIVQISYDIFMFAFVGAGLSAVMADWYKEEKADAKDGDIIDGLKLCAVLLAVNSVKNSFMDFNFIDSVGSPGASWTPIAFDWTKSQISNVYLTALGEKNLFWDTILNANISTRQFKPLWSLIRPQED